MFEDDGTIGDLFEEDGEEESLFVEDDPKENAALDYDQENLIVDCIFSPVKSAVKNGVTDTRPEIKCAPVIKKGIARKITKPAAKPSSYWISETENVDWIGPFAPLKKKRTSARNKDKKQAWNSSTEDEDEEGDDRVCESLKKQNTLNKNRDEDDLIADSLADRIKRSRRHSHVTSRNEKIISEVRDHKLSQKSKGNGNTINADHDNARHSKSNDDRMRNSSMAKTRLSTTINTEADHSVIILSDFSSPEKRKRGASEEGRTTRKFPGRRPRRTCVTVTTKNISTTTSTSVGKAKESQHAARISKQPLSKATGAVSAIAAEPGGNIQTKQKGCMFLNPAFRPSVAAQKATKTAPASNALFELKITARVRKDSGVGMSPTNADILTGGEYIAGMGHVDMFEKQRGRNTRDLDRPRPLVIGGYNRGVADLCVSPETTHVHINWTSEELAALGFSPLRKPILSPKRKKTVSFNVPGVYKLQSQEAASGIQSLVGSESEVPGLSENKSTSEAETWIETPGHTSEDGTSANSQAAQDGHLANPQSALTIEDAQAAVILAHLAYRDVLGQRERAGINEQAFNDAVQRIGMPRRWVFMNGALDGITDTTPSSQLLMILESEVALIEAQYNIQRSRSQHFTPAHAIFWNQVLLPIKRFLSNYRTANMVITKSNAETIVLALSREEVVSQLDMVAQENLQDSNREVIAAMGLLAMGNMVSETHTGALYCSGRDRSKICVVGKEVGLVEEMYP